MDGSTSDTAVTAPTPGRPSFLVQTQWNYSSEESNCLCCAGRHAFTRGGRVIESDFRGGGDNGYPTAIASRHLAAAIASFGDGVRVTFTVEPSEAEPVAPDV